MEHNYKEEGNQLLMKCKRVADEDVRKALLQPDMMCNQRSLNLTEVPFMRVGASVKKLVKGKRYEELVELQDNKIHCGHCYLELMMFMKESDDLNIDRIEGRLKHHWDHECDDPKAQENNKIIKLSQRGLSQHIKNVNLKIHHAKLDNKNFGQQSLVLCTRIKCCHGSRTS